MLQLRNCGVAELSSVGVWFPNTCSNSAKFDELNFPNYAWSKSIDKRHYFKNTTFRF